MDNLIYGLRQITLNIVLYMTTIGATICGCLICAITPHPWNLGGIMLGVFGVIMAYADGTFGWSRSIRWDR